MFLNRFSALFRLSAVRQTFWLLSLFSLISLVAWGGTFLLVQRDMLRGVDARLETRMEAATVALAAGMPLPAPQNGETASYATTGTRDGFETRDAEGTETEMRYLTRATEYGRIQLGENTERQEELLDLMSGGMTLSLMATLFFTALTGLWMARRSQARLNSINRGLAAVAGGDLSARIALEGTDDLSLLTQRINTTTARLEGAMTQMRVQSSNIAHDLRTPLARLRAQLETSQTEAAERGQPISQDVLNSAIDQIDRINGTFDALLRLARIESGRGREKFTRIDLGDLVAGVEDVFGPVIEDAGQTLCVKTQDPAIISGDRELLVQFLANLMQNALRYGADNQTIMLQVQGTQVSLSDEGPGVPREDREKVLQPLYQRETTRQSEGYGLGLSLVRAIAELHGADLTLSDGQLGRGLRVSLDFRDNTEL